VFTLLALHRGQVIHGNVGGPERLQFTVVGSVVNEVVRVQDLTKQLNSRLHATDPFAAAVAGSWRPVGEHVLRRLETRSGDCNHQGRSIRVQSSRWTP
jgi:adenylate cyclase